jgi:putative ABC transport system permease protein
LFGLQPALASARTDVASGLEGRQGVSTGRRGLLGAHLLTTIEVALAVVLVVSAGLLVRSIGNLRGVDSGVATEGVLTFEVAAPAWKYRSNPDLLLLAQRILERVVTVPGVREAAVARSIPFAGQGWTSEFTIDGWPADRYGVEVRHRQVTPGYFPTLRVPVREGTVFGDPVTSGGLSQVVVNQAFVDQWFAGESPVGRRITYNREPAADAQWSVVVGVVGMSAWSSRSTRCLKSSSTSQRTHHSRCTSSSGMTAAPRRCRRRCVQRSRPWSRRRQSAGSVRCGT